MEEVERTRQSCLEVSHKVGDRPITYKVILLQHSMVMCSQPDAKAISLYFLSALQRDFLQSAKLKGMVLKYFYSPGKLCSFLKPMRLRENVFLGLPTQYSLSSFPYIFKIQNFHAYFAV